MQAICGCFAGSSETFRVIQFYLDSRWLVNYVCGEM